MRYSEYINAHLCCTSDYQVQTARCAIENDALSISPSLMVVPYHSSCVVLRAAAGLLNLQFQCTATAFTFLHKFHSAVPQGKYDEQVGRASLPLFLLLWSMDHIWYGVDWGETALGQFLAGILSWSVGVDFADDCCGMSVQRCQSGGGK